MPFKDKQAEKEYMLNYRLENKQYFSDKYKEWVKANRKARAKSHKKWRKANKHKRAAQGKVYYEIKRGRLIKLPCGKCKNVMSEAHHPDYSKPLYVIWLCKKHHEETHHAPT